MNSKKLKISILHAMLINPLLNIVPIFLINIFYDNQSYIGNALHHKIYLLAWAFSSAIGFYVYSKYIWDYYEINYNKKIHLLSCGGMFVSCIIPYSTNYTFTNDLHIWLAILSVCLFIYEWVKLYFDKNYFLSTLFQNYFKYLMIHWIVCTLTLTSIGHVTAFSEILFSFNTNFILVKWLKNLYAKKS